MSKRTRRLGVTVAWTAWITCAVSAALASPSDEGLSLPWYKTVFELSPGAEHGVDFQINDPGITVHVTAVANKARARFWDKKVRRKGRPRSGGRGWDDPRPLVLSLLGPDGEVVRRIRGVLPLRMAYRVPRSRWKRGQGWRVTLRNHALNDVALGTLWVDFAEMHTQRRQLLEVDYKAPPERRWKPIYQEDRRFPPPWWDERCGGRSWESRYRYRSDVPLR